MGLLEAQLQLKDGSQRTVSVFFDSVHNDGVIDDKELNNAIDALGNKIITDPTLKGATLSKNGEMVFTESVEKVHVLKEGQQPESDYALHLKNQNSLVEKEISESRQVKTNEEVKRHFEALMGRKILRALNNSSVTKLLSPIKEVLKSDNYLLSPVVTALREHPVVKDVVSFSEAVQKLDETEEKKKDQIQLEGAPLTAVELAKIPTDTPAGRFLHWVGRAKSIKELYEFILNSTHSDDKTVPGIIRPEDIRKYENNVGWPIRLEPEGEHLKVLEAVLRRNTLTGKGKEDTQLADELFYGDPKQKEDYGIMSLIRLANDPDVNVPDHQNSDPGADRDPQTGKANNSLSYPEVNAIAKFLTDKIKKEHVFKDALELVASYKSVIAYYKYAVWKARKIER